MSKFKPFTVTTSPVNLYINFLETLGFRVDYDGMVREMLSYLIRSPEASEEHRVVLATGEELGFSKEMNGGHCTHGVVLGLAKAAGLKCISPQVFLGHLRSLKPVSMRVEPAEEGVGRESKASLATASTTPRMILAAMEPLVCSDGQSHILMMDDTEGLHWITGEISAPDQLVDPRLHWLFQAE